MQARNSLLCSAALLLLAAATAHAADFPVRPVAAPAPILFNWAGVYAGVHGGYSWENANDLPMKGGFGGGQIGANYRTGPLVFGLEADLSGGSISASASGIVFGIPATASSKINYFGTVRGRLGVALDRGLFYGTGGFAWAHNTLSATALGVTISSDTTHTGWTVGGGFEYALARNWSGKIEYLFSEYNSADYNFGGTIVSSGETQFHTVKVGINYLFR